MLIVGKITLKGCFEAYLFSCAFQLYIQVSHSTTPAQVVQVKGSRGTEVEQSHFSFLVRRCAVGGRGWHLTHPSPEAGL